MTTKTWLAPLFVAVLCATGDGTVRAQNPRTPQPLTLEKIQDDLYVILGDGSNTTVLLTDEGVVLVDSKNDRNYDDIVATVKTLTDAPIRYVINTHPHGDHVGANQKLRTTAQLVGHVHARAAMIAGQQPGPPPITYTDQMSIHLGGKEVVLRHFGPCHTNGDTFVYFPMHGVLATGDCFNTGNGRGLNPTGAPTVGLFVDYKTGGSFLEWPRAADAALRLDWDVVVPGHGPLTDRPGFLTWRTAIDTLRDRMSSMLDEGRTSADIQKMVAGEFEWAPRGAAFNAIIGMVAELKQ